MAFIAIKKLVNVLFTLSWNEPMFLLWNGSPCLLLAWIIVFLDMSESFPPSWTVSFWRRRSLVFLVFVFLSWSGSSLRFFSVGQDRAFVFLSWSGQSLLFLSWVGLSLRFSSIGQDWVFVFLCWSGPESSFSSFGQDWVFVFLNWSGQSLRFLSWPGLSLRFSSIGQVRYCPHFVLCHQLFSWYCPFKLKNEIPLLSSHALFVNVRSFIIVCIRSLIGASR